MKFPIDLTRLNKFSKRKSCNGSNQQLIGSLILLACTFGCSIKAAQAEGSRDLYPNGASGSRANLEWQTVEKYGPTTPTDNSLLRRTLLQVYANKDEYILLGSSAVGVDSGDILIYDAKGGRIGNETLSSTNLKFKCSAQRTLTGNTANQGKITSRKQEVAGPDTITNDIIATPGSQVTDGYVPCYYKAPANGIYYIVFYGPNGDANSSSSGNNIPADIGLTDSKNFDKNQGSTVAAWDVTVRSSLTSTTDIKGRLFADYLALFTGNNGRPIYSKFYVVTKDGFRYESNLNGLDPNAFLIYGNDVGYYDSDGKSPLYHDVLGDNGNNSGSLSILKGSTNFALPTHTILFNNPQSSAGAMDVINIRGLPISPILPKIETLPNGDPIFKFIGNVSNNTSVINKGGNFIFDTNVLGSYEIIISKDGINFDPNKPENRQLRGLVTTTTGQTANWDGKDNSGNPFPVGTDYKAQIVIRNGEYHFPLIDAENSTLGGPSFTLLNAINSLGNKVGFYDDRGYKTLSGVNVGTPGQVLCGANPPNPALSDAINGFDTTGIGRKYGSNPGSNTNTSCTGSFGDAKGLDIWTYIPSQAAFSNVNIIAPSTPTAEKTVAIVEDNDKSGGTTPLANQTATPGDTLEYTIIVKNTSTTTPATTVVLTDNIPANTTYVPGSLQISAGENSGAKTDTNADDQADYDGTAKVVKFRLGLGANATKGGTLGITAADNTTTIKFRIKINDPIPAGVISVSNQAIISSDGNTDVKSNDPGTEDLPNDPTISKLGPRLRLVKRVTGIRKKNATTTTAIALYNNLADSEPGGINDNPTVAWTPSAETYLLGAIATEQIPTSPGIPAPQDEIEYTIYFLSDGAMTAKDVNLCDFIPANQTYVAGTMQMSLSGATPSDIIDGSGILPNSGFYPNTTTTFPTACKEINNNNGAVYFRVGDIIPANITPTSSYGFIRFRAKVN